MFEPRTGRGDGSRRSFVAVPLLAALATCLVAQSACQGNLGDGENAAGDPVTLTIGFPHATGQDPLHGIQQAARLISFEGLSSSARDGRSQPRLAEGWTESPDGLSWRIKLRSNALFHDGSPVDAASVKMSLERSLRGPDRDFYPGLADIVSIETPTPTEILIRLRDRSTFLLDDLTVAIVKTQADGVDVGTGPFELETTSSDEISMKAFTPYYRGPPTIDRIVWKLYPALRAGWAALMRREIDFLYEVGPEALEFIQPETSVGVFPFLRSFVYGVIFNSKRPVFQDPRVRQALNYAVDRAKLVEQAFKGHGRTANGPTWPLHWAYDESVPSYSYDPARAAALLDAAGLSLSRPTDDHAAPARLRFTCLLPANFTLWERMGLLVQRNLSEVGVDMRIEEVPFDALNERIASGNFDALFIEMIAGNSPARPYFFWHSASKRNVWGYSNGNVDAALGGIRNAKDDDAYRQAFRRFQIEMFEDPPALFLALGETSRAVSRRFAVVAPQGGDIAPSIADWKLEIGSRLAN